MAVSTTNAISGPYIANGVTVTFPFSFTAPSPDEVDVVLVDDAGRETSLTGYDVSIVQAGGGSVTFSTPPMDASKKLFVLLDPSFRQEIAFENGSAWRAEPVNDGYDRSALRDQVLRRDVSRGIKTPLGEPGALLPTAASRASKALFFNEEGAPEPISVEDFAAPAAEQAGRAEVAAGAAEAFVGPTFTTVLAGLAATLSGQFFAVTNGTTTTVYLNNAGSAVYQRDALTPAALADPSKGAALVGFGHAAPYISKTVGDRLSKTVYVTDDDFNATPDGPYCTTAIQRALDQGASKIILPALRTGQNYRIEGTLEVPSQVEITGHNRWATGIVSDDLDAPIFYGDGVQNVTFRELRLAYNGTPALGADGVLLEDSFVCQLEGMWFNNTYNGARFEGGGNANILGYRSFGYKGAGLMVSNAIDINMVAFRMSANDSINGLNGGIYLVGGVEAFVATSGDITLGQHGIVTAGIGASTARGQSPWHNKVIGVYFDSARFQGAYMRQATDFQFHSSWIASSGHDEAVGFGSAEDYSGLDASACTHLMFSGGELYNNGGRGALIYPDCKHTAIVGYPLVARNQYTRSIDRAGVEFLAGTTDFICHIRAERDPDTTMYRQTDAVRIAPGASDRYDVRALLGGCTAFDGGSGTNKSFGPNY